MPPPRTCPDCGSAMVDGFIPDATYGAILQTHWYEGDPEKATFLGLPTGLKVDRQRMIPVWTYRCSSCGLLKSYASHD